MRRDIELAHVHDKTTEFGLRSGGRRKGQMVKRCIIVGLAIWSRDDFCGGSIGSCNAMHLSAYDAAQDP